MCSCPVWLTPDKVLSEIYVFHILFSYSYKDKWLFLLVDSSENRGPDSVKYWENMWQCLVSVQFLVLWIKEFVVVNIRPITAPLWFLWTWLIGYSANRRYLKNVEELLIWESMKEILKSEWSLRIAQRYCAHHCWQIHNKSLWTRQAVARSGRVVLHCSFQQTFSVAELPSSTISDGIAVQRYWFPMGQAILSHFPSYGFMPSCVRVFFMSPSATNNVIWIILPLSVSFRFFICLQTFL